MKALNAPSNLKSPNNSCSQGDNGRGQILRALSLWPKDPVRPELQFGDILRQQIEQQKTSTLSDEQQLKQANALYSLLDNRYKKKVRISRGHLLSLSRA
ncbi:hypothetical protein SLS62_000600 [Diatrype stigma]|uniref:Uncharacterized protein n=1 Tax=Diatrype stigma TaxID=117547 RepID=A0AAN9V3R6_9PEZI